ncbi:MAG: hypothetical protein IT462_07210 [Planctomycetes bacterium]|nr:hypothetical protein [Planctomycetota bacterium]
MKIEQHFSTEHTEGTEENQRQLRASRQAAKRHALSKNLLATWREKIFTVFSP